MSHSALAVAAALALTLALVLADANRRAYPAETPGEACAVVKFKVAVRRDTSESRCDERAIAHNVAVDGVCLARADAKFSAAFQKAEAAGGCTTTGDASTVAAEVDAFLAEVVAELTNGVGTDAARVCAIAKLKAAAKVTATKGFCSERAISKGAAASAACLPNVVPAFDKAEAKGGCATTGDAGEIETDVNRLVAALGHGLSPTSTLPCGVSLTLFLNTPYGLVFPNGVAVDASGDVFVGGQGGVLKFDDQGTLLTTWTLPGGAPDGIAVDANGNVFAVDGYNGLMDKFDNGGTFLTSWALTQGGFPAGVAVDASGDVFVTDSAHDRVQKFDNDGTFLTMWGSTGSGPGQFNFPSGIAVDADGNVFVADNRNDRIEKFDTNGTFLTSWGSEGSAAGQFDLDPVFYYSSYIAVDAGGDVFVSDPGGFRVEEFTDSGTFLSTCGGAGMSEGEFGGTPSPTGIAVDASGNVFVGSYGRVQKFGTL
jgi:hypothetical protein